MNVNRYSYKSYKMIRNLDESGRIPWASKSGNCYSDKGLGFVWLAEDAGV